ncbi:MAG: MtrB/PioB family decaheme-associated outer membrane protein [Halioglobus sp.]
MTRRFASGLAVLAVTACPTQAAEPDRRRRWQLTRPPPARWQTDYRGVLELGAAYVSDDSSQFGQYNSLQEAGASLIGQLQWQTYSPGNSYWQGSVSDLGLDTREGTLTWGLADTLTISAGFDSQVQVRNDSGRTPFRGNTQLRLADDWTSGLTTADFDTLEASLRKVERELSRDRLFIDVQAKVAEQWRTRASASYEQKSGTGDIGGAIYIDAAAGDAVLLPLPVDQDTLDVALGVAYEGRRLFVDSELSYSRFDNQNDLLTWQNPYSAYGTDVAFPSGIGGLGLAPDNDYLSGRLSANWVISATTRMQLDGSYARATQDQDYAPYSVNPALAVTEPLPLTHFDGEVDTATLRARLLLRPLPKLDTTLSYALRDRNYNAPRDGYRYIRGDADAQPDAAFTVYNSSHDLTENTVGIEADYRLPGSSRLGLEYAYQETERRNAAVAETREDTYTLKYRVRPWQGVTARAQLEFADRAASTYHWDQDYYALLDSELINATPDNQRFNNHPALFQYYLANRERSEATLDISALPSTEWTLSINLRWRDEHYDQSDLGLTDSQWARVHGSASYTAGEELTLTVYAGVDRFEYAQDSRAFRGGQEKNPFAIHPPLPQASDPAQNWSLDATDTSLTAGASLTWQVAPRLSLEMDYSLVSTTAEQDFSSGVAAGLAPSDLPEVDTRLHELDLSGLWQMRDNLAFRLSYRFYYYQSDDWALDGVAVDTIDKVLSFGAENPNEDIHYLGASVVYRWQ